MAIGKLRHVGTPGQKKVTRALLKFCREHNHTPFWISKLEEFLGELDARDVSTLQELIILLRQARMGSFHDWFPALVYSHENEEYVDCLWNALYGHWLTQVEPITQVENA